MANMVPVSIQMKILKQYEGKSISKAIYALDIYHEHQRCRKIHRELRKLKGK